MKSMVFMLLLVALALQAVLLAIGYRLNMWIFSGNETPDDEPPFHSPNNNNALDPRRLATIHVLCDWVLLVTMGLAFCWNFELWAAAFCLALALHVMLECKTQRNGVLYHRHSTGLVAGLWHKAWCAGVFTTIAFVCWAYETDRVHATWSSSTTITAEWSMNKKLALMGACITGILVGAAIFAEFTRRWRGRASGGGDDKGVALVHNSEQC